MFYPLQMFLSVCKSRIYFWHLVALSELKIPAASELREKQHRYKTITATKKGISRSILTLSSLDSIYLLNIYSERRWAFHMVWFSTKGSAELWWAFMNLYVSRIRPSTHDVTWPWRSTIVCESNHIPRGGAAYIYIWGSHHENSDYGEAKA